MLRSFYVFLLCLLPLTCAAINAPQVDDSLLKELYEEQVINSKKDSIASKKFSKILFEMDSLIRNNKKQRRTPFPIPTTNNPNHGELSAPFTSAEYINPIVGGFITLGFLLFGIYIFFRVRRELKKDRLSK